jgi:uncharacterized membrane protein
MITTETTMVPNFTSRLFRQKKLLFSAAVLVIFHCVGFWGLCFSSDPEYYQNLTPLNLLLTAFLLFLNHQNFNKSFWLLAGFTFTIGFLGEVLGVHTGLLFGNYEYGQALGFKLFQVPLLIGLNWVILVYAAGCVARTFLKKPLISVLAAAFFMVGLDYFIEPVAMHFDFWSWQNNAVPVQNYAGWFALALVLQLYFQFSNVTKRNPLAVWVFAVQSLFFIALKLCF